MRRCNSITSKTLDFGDLVWLHVFSLPAYEEIFLAMLRQHRLNFIHYRSDVRTPVTRINNLPINTPARMRK